MDKVLEEMAVLVPEDLLSAHVDTIADSLYKATPARWESVVPATHSCEPEPCPTVQKSVSDHTGHLPSIQVLHENTSDLIICER